MRVGSVCLYQGEELALTEAELNFEELVDPFGIAFWPEFKGRDGCRTPMPWDTNEQAGFSQQSYLWLPVPTQHYPLAVSNQEQDPNSCLNAYRDFLAFRKNRLALKVGDITFLFNDEHRLIFIRRYQDQSCLIAINTSQDEFQHPSQHDLKAIELPNSLPVGKIEAGLIILPAYSVVIADLIEE